MKKSYFKNEELYKKAIVELQNDEGANINSLSKKYGFDRGCFSRYLKKQGISVHKPIRSKGTTDKYIRASHEYIEDKVSISSLAEKYKISEKSFALYLKEKNLTRWHGDSASRYEVNENYFETIDSADKAYWLGMLFADGSVCVRDDNRGSLVTLELADFDINHLQKFKEALKYTGPIHHRSNRPTASVRICRNKMVSDLIKYGCVPNKTNEGWIELEAIKNFELDFVRGFLDGDGYIESRDFGKYRIVFTIKSKKVLESINAILVNYHPEFEKDGNYYRLRIERKQDFFKLLEDLYSEAGVYLDRKYYIAQARLNARPTQQSFRELGKKSAE